MLMKRFNEEDEGFFDEEENEYFEGESSISYDENDVLNTIHELEMFEMNLNKKIMDQSIEIASKNWFWKFKKLTDKHAEIDKTYKFLKEMYESDLHIESDLSELFGSEEFLDESEESEE